MTNVPGLALTVGANQNYGVICYLVYQASASATVVQFQFTGPSIPSAVIYSAQFQTAPNTPAYFEPASAIGFSSALGASGLTPNTNLSTLIHLGLINGPNAGTVQLQAAPQVTGTITVQAGSWCAVQ
jgi:hypothetical protein